MISSYGPATAGSSPSLDGLLPAFDGNTKPPATGFFVADFAGLRLL
jgi:hypothetical protein